MSMPALNLYDLGEVPWLESQLLYHALPRMGGAGIILLVPGSPYVCIGCHQDAEQEVDLAFCKERGIPVFRREVGGGAVYLDGNQLFYQLVLPRDHPAAHGSKEAIYRRLLEPVVRTYRSMGIDAAYKPVNDILAGARKISGNGAADIADSLVLVGNLILDFDYQMMARVLRVPDEKFRDKVYQALGESLTTIHRELGRVPPLADLKAALVREFERVLGPLHPAPLPENVHAKAAELAPQFTSEDWLFKGGRRRREREVKIRHGLHVVERSHKAPGGLIRLRATLSDGRLEDVELSGDFFFYPGDSLAELEQALDGIALDEVEAAIEQFYATHCVQSPGVAPMDLGSVFRI